MNTSKNNETPLRTKKCIFLCMGMVIPAAFIFSVMADLPHVFLISTIGLLYSYKTEKAMKYNDRSIIYSILGAIITALFFDYVFELDRDRFGLVSSIFQANTTVPFLLFLAVFITFFESSAYVLGLCACFSLAALMLSGDVLDMHMENDRIPFLNFLVGEIQNVRIFYLTILTIEFAFILLALNEARKSVRKVGKSQHFKVLKNTLVIGSVVMIPLVAAGSLYLFELHEQKFKDLETMFIRLNFRRPRSGDKIIFSKDIDLNRTINPNVLNNQEKIIIRAVSKEPPGYLRGKAYTFYENGRWSNKNEASGRMNVVDEEGLLAFKTFYFEKEELFKDQCHIFPTSDLQGNTLYIPGNTEQIQIIAERINYTPDGHFTAEDWKKGGGYTVCLPKSDQNSAFPQPDSKNWQDLLQVPEDISENMEEILGNVMRHNMVKDTAPDREVVYTISAWFNNQFDYELGVANNTKLDPIINFMKNAKKGHCELFATSTVMLLRKRGIPARYITGFVCEEQHPSGRYSVARLGNAHAWVEAYLRDENKWILVESTPPSGVPNFKHDWGTFESWSDRLSQFFQQTLADLRRGYFAKAIVGFFTSFFIFIWDLLNDPLRGPLLILPVLSIVIFLISRRYKKRKNAKKSRLSDTNARLNEEFISLEAFISARTGLARAPSMTINEWGSLLAENKSLSFLKDLFINYQALRYRNSEPGNEKVNEILTMMKEARKKIPKKKDINRKKEVLV